MNDLAHNFTAQTDTPTDMQGVEQGYAISDLISTYTPATPDQLEPHEHLKNLALLLGDDKLLYIDDTIMQGGKPLSVAGENVDTENTVAVVMYDERLEPSNLAFYPLNKTTNKPFLLNPHATANFVACDNWQAGKPMGERLAVSDLNNALALFGIMDLDLAGRTIITPFSDDCWQVINSVKASSERVTVFTDYSKDKQGRYIKDLYANALSRHNATLVITPEPLSIIYHDMAGYEVKGYSDLLAVGEIQHFDNYLPWHDGKTLLDTPIKYEGGRFELYNDGLYFVRYEFDSDKDQYKKTSAMWLCSTLYYKASIRGKDSTAWGILLQWRDRDNYSHEWAMPSELLQGDSKEYRQILAYQGLDIAPSIKARNYLTAYLQTYTTHRRALSVNKTGWHEGSYVLPHKVIAPPKGEQIVLQTTHPLEHGYSEAGTLTDWQEHISKPIASQSRVAFAVSCAFAGQLFSVLGMGENEGGGFHFVGNSSIGKSITLALAGSVWGKGIIKTWRNTDNSLESTALIYNDNILCLDELNEADPRTIGKTVYMLANGQGKGRMNGKTGNNRNLAKWRVLVLSNGEKTLETYLKEAGETIKAGQEVRLISIEADTGRGLGIFDSLTISDTPAKQAETLKAHANRYYGVAGIAWLEYLTHTNVSDTAQQLKQQFLRHYPKLDSQAQRVANRFALVAVAGELATQAGITGWQAGQAMTATRACLNNWLSNYGDIGNHETRQILKQVQGFLQVNKSNRFKEWDSDFNDRLPNRAGFYRPDSNCFYIFPIVFENEVCKGYSKKQVASVLDSKGLLHKSHGYQLNVKSTDPDKKGYFYCIKGSIIEMPM